MATISQSCSWCHALVRVGIKLCPSCGHQPHVARLFCQCPKCARVTSDLSYLAWLREITSRGVAQGEDDGPPHQHEEGSR